MEIPLHHLLSLNTKNLEGQEAPLRPKEWLSPVESYRAQLWRHKVERVPTHLINLSSWGGQGEESTCPKGYKLGGVEGVNKMPWALCQPTARCPHLSTSPNGLLIKELSLPVGGKVRGRELLDQWRAREKE